MENLKIIVMIVSIIVIVFLSAGFSFTVTKNSYYPIDNRNKIIEITTYSLEMGSQLEKSKDE